MVMTNNEKVCVWDDNADIIIFDSREAAEKAGFTFEDMMPLVEFEEIMLEREFDSHSPEDGEVW
jgi:hypothetical protein